MRAMKILLVTWYFPPINDVAAIRTGAMAQYFRKQGHDVFVLTASRVGDASLVVPVAPDKIRRARWFDVDVLRVRSEFDAILAPKAASQAVAPEASKTWLARFRAWSSDAYTQIAHLPDRQVGWFFFAMAAGRELAKGQKFDLIYASGPPFTTHRIARALSRELGVPWIAEYRDAWSRYFYVPRPGWRQALDERIENATIRSAAAIVAVTPPWADYYRERFGKPVAVVFNGFDAQGVGAAESEPAGEKPVSIAYFGVLYDGLRDPSNWLTYSGDYSGQRHSPLKQITPENVGQRDEDDRRVDDRHKDAQGGVSEGDPLVAIAVHFFHWGH